MHGCTCPGEVALGALSSPQLPVLIKNYSRTEPKIMGVLIKNYSRTEPVIMGALFQVRLQKGP